MGLKLGVCEWSLPVNGASAVEMAAKAGFDGIQIGDLGGAENGFPMNSPAIQKSYLDAARSSGITLQSLHPYGLQRAGGMLFPTDTPEGRRGTEEIRRSIDACEAMGIPILMVSSFFATLLRNEWDFEAFSDQLRYAIRYGRDRGVRIVYESVLSPGRILRMSEAVGEGLYICYDTLNPIRWGTGDPAEEIPKLSGLIDHFHVKDAPFDLKGYAMLSKGRGRFRETASLIRSSGFDGWIVSENYYTTLAKDSGRDFLDLMKEDVLTIREAFGI